MSNGQRTMSGERPTPEPPEPIYLGLTTNFSTIALGGSAIASITHAVTSSGPYLAGPRTPRTGARWS